MISGNRHTLPIKIPIIGILRGIGSDVFGPLMQASFGAGLQAIEVTMNTAEAERIVAANRGRVPAGRYLGMGTIRNLDEAERAHGAGAMFLVSPNLDPAVIRYAHHRNIPIIAGALTPSEVYRAWNEGASMVKVFPCGTLGGPKYIRELKGPFDQIPLVAVGGVSLDNMTDYLRAGAAGVGIGISLFGEAAVKEGDWETVGRNVGEFIKRCSAG